MQCNVFNLSTLESKSMMDITNCFELEKTHITLLLKIIFNDWWIEIEKC